MRPLALLALIAAAAAFPEEEGGLKVPLASSRAKGLRAEGAKRWSVAEATWQKVRRHEVVEPAELVLAIEASEDAVAKLEQSVRVEWDGATNDRLAEACRAWFGLRALLPEPATGEEKDAEKRRQKRIQDVRKLAMEYGASRRYELMLRRCDRCDGRGHLRSAFGDRPPPCSSCAQRGTVPDRGAILEARWLLQSPLYRADAGNSVRMDLDLRQAAIDAARFRPFVLATAIDGEPEDHDVWARVRVKEKVTEEPRGKSETRTTTHTFFRVGRVWYLWDPRADAALVTVPADGAPSGSDPGGSTAGSPSDPG